MPYLKNADKKTAGYITNLSNSTVWSTVTNIQPNYTIAANGILSGVNIPTTSLKKGPPPMGWNTYKLSNSDDEVYEAPSGQCHLGSLNISNPNGKFHFDIFTKLFPKVEYLHVGVADVEDVRASPITNVLFTNTREGAMFEEWLTAYTKRFGSREKLYSNSFPPPPSRSTPLSSIAIIPKDNVMTMTSDLAVWLFQHCEAAVYSTGLYLFFESDNDLVAYQMTFT